MPIPNIRTDTTTVSDDHSLTDGSVDNILEKSSVVHDDRFETLMDATILLVDDEPFTTDLVKTFLEDQGYKHLVTTSDSVQALGLMVRERPDVVLLDLVMPNVSGFEILESVRSDKKLEYTPIIILTSSTDADTKLKALELGANDFLAKPVDPSELALRVRNTLAAKAYQDRLAFYDTLTGLPNRRTFMDQVYLALQNANQEDISCAVLQINLDRFRQINDAFGPKVGDALLAEVAQRLEAHLRADDAVGRLGKGYGRTGLCRVGGDEFTVLLPEIELPEVAAQVARRILTLMEDPFCPEGHELYVSPSIGIAVCPDDGEEMNALLTHAEAAMSHAKQQGGNACQFYSDKINAKSAKQLRLANQLRKAIDRDELTLFYQPKLDVRTGRVIGAEALVRWKHPDLGILPPGEFVPIAEETGLIVLLDEWALNEACTQVKTWATEGVGELRMAVNITSQHFRNNRIIDAAEQVLKSSGLNPRYLELELTENMILENAKENIDAMHQLKEMGLRLALDDFGTGYSSFSYLQQLPLDVLKIDRSFIKDIEAVGDSRAIVTAIIAMAHSLGLSAVAEGVETEGQLAFLRNRDCGSYQGYLFSPPVPAAEFALRFGNKRLRTEPKQLQIST